MSRKRPKKRYKPYTGTDAVDAQPTVTRYRAVVRSPLGQWWIDNKKRIRLLALVGGGVLLVGYLLYELLRLVF